MRILFVTLSLMGGGAERVVSALSSKLSGNPKNDIHLLVYIKKNNEYSLSDSVKRHQMSQSDYNNKLKRITYTRKIIKEVKPEIVIPFLNEPMMFTFLASRFIGVSFVSTVRNNPDFYIKNDLKGKFIRRITEKAGRCMLQTSSQANYFKWKNDSQYFVVPNPVKQEMLDSDYSYRKTAERIVTCGRLDKQKNHSLLIKAFAKAVAEIPNLKLYIYGEGQEHDNLMQLIDSLNLQEAVFLPGNTQNVANELVDSDIFVLSSDYEGMPNALMEAMAVGLPCISTDCPTGPADLIVDGTDGIIIAPDDEKAMTEKIKLLSCNYELREKLGKNAKEKMQKNYSIDAVTDLFINQVR